MATVHAAARVSVRLFVQHRDNARLCSPQTPRNIGSQLLLGNISAPSKHGRTVEMSELEVIWSSLVWESVFQHYVTSYISSAHTLRLFGMTDPVEVSGNPFVNTALKVYGKLRARKPEKVSFRLWTRYPERISENWRRSTVIIRPHASPVSDAA